MTLDVVDVAMRLAAAAGVGILLGINRDLAHKPIGMRTLALVSLGAAVVCFAIEIDGLAEHPDALSRVVQGVLQGVMAGISFIGAGTILRNQEEHAIEGLTTAATVWVAAALGIACGFGLWGVVAVGLAIGLLILVGMRWLEAKLDI